MYHNYFIYHTCIGCKCIQSFLLIIEIYFNNLTFSTFITKMRLKLNFSIVYTGCEYIHCTFVNVQLFYVLTYIFGLHRNNMPIYKTHIPALAHCISSSSQRPLQDRYPGCREYSGSWPLETQQICQHSLEGQSR